MTYSQSIDKTQKFADFAIERIEKERLLPTPENYELWFVYYSKSDPELIKAIDALVKKSKGRLSDEHCYEIFTRFLSGQRENKVVKKAGDKIQDTIKDVNAAVTFARQYAVEYNKSLGSLNKELNEDKTLDEINVLLSYIMVTTEEMIGHNKRVEGVLERSNIELSNMRKDLEIARKEAMTDPLTGLANRKAFDQEARDLKELSNNGDEPHAFSLIFLDIDHFKNFNDRFGHQIGDQVLKLIARTLNDGVKGRDLVVRYGGEEFAILLPETNIQGGMKVAELLRNEVENKELINRATGKKIAKITFSAGVAEYRKGESIDDLVERVDKALYDAKDAGRNQVVVAK